MSPIFLLQVSYYNLIPLFAVVATITHSLTLSLALLGSASLLSIVPFCCLYPPRLPPSRGMADLPPASDPSGTCRGRARALPEFRRLASPCTARAAFPGCHLPTGIPDRDNGAAYQGKHPPRCQPATKTQTEGEKGKNKCKYSTTLAGGREKKKKIPAAVHKAKSDASLSVL